MQPVQGQTSPSVRSFEVVEGEGQFQVFAQVFEMGPDCLVIVWGGTRPHVGAVGMAQVRASLRDPKKSAATSSVFTFVGHKEDGVAKTMSEELARRLERNTIVAAGIHWDNLTDQDIKVITRLCQKLIDGITEKFKALIG